LIQPDMVAGKKILRHILFTALILPAIVLVIVPASYHGMPLDQAGMILAGVTAVAALGHLAAALANPNRDREANRERAAAEVAAGRVELVQAGQGIDLADPPATITLAHLVALAALVLAVPGFLAPVIVRPADGWPLNPQLKPQ